MFSPRSPTSHFKLVLAVTLLIAFAVVSLQIVPSVYALAHSNSGNIIIPSSGTASPYPSTIFVDGEPGYITDVDVTLFDITHTWPDDVNVLLVSPAGNKVILMADACGTADLTTVDLTFSDEAASVIPDSTSCAAGGSYRPGDYSGGGSLPAPAPAQPYSKLLSSLDNITPHGNWLLYVEDDSGGDGGNIASGWRLTITTTTEIIVIPSVGTAAPYPYNIEVTGKNGLITDVNITLSMSHTWPDDVDILLRSPDGDTVVLMSDACGSEDMRTDTITFDQAAANVIPDSPASYCSGSYRPANYGSDTDNNDWNVSGAPHGTSMNDFNNENPNGTWNLYVYDDASGLSGFISYVSLNITTTGTSIIQMPITSQTDGEGKANPYPYNIVVSGYTGVITDANITINNFTHSEPNDIDMLLVSPNNVAVVLMSDACGLSPMTNVDLEFNDEDFNTPFENIPDVGPCTSGTYRPANWDNDEALPSPAPGLPYYDRMSAFDGFSPNGTWKLYINDAYTNDAGFITGPITLTFDTTSVLTNAITNFGFSSGETGWLEYGGGAGSVVSGVYQFQRTSGSDAFTIFQTTSADFPAETPFELRFNMGNTGTVRKRITVLLWDEAFARQRACSFWIDPSQPLRTYQILSDVPDATTWTNVTVHFYASTTSTNGYYTLDNVIMRRRDDLPTQGAEVLETLCIDPTAPYGDDGADGANLLTNGTFSSAIGNGDGTWGPFGSINYFITGGVLNMQRLAEGAAILQNTNSALNANDRFELAVDLGNNAGVWQRVTILLHHETFSDLQFCTFWLAPGQPLSTYLIRTYADTTWNSQGITVSIYPSTSSQYILVDNVVLRERTEMKVIGVGCYEPGSVQPAMDDAWMQEQFDQLAQGQLLLPTATPFAPYSAPDVIGELPIIATPSAPTEFSAPDEGSVSE